MRPGPVVGNACVDDQGKRLAPATTGGGHLFACGVECGSTDLHD